MEDLIKYLDGKFNELNKRMDSIDSELRVVNLKLDKLREDQPKDIMAILQTIDKNTKANRKDIDFLAESVGRHELTINRINRQ